MTGGTDAARRLELLRRNRAAEIERLVRGMHDEPAWGASRLAGLGPQAEGYEAFVAAGGLTPGLWPVLHEVLAARGPLARDLDRLLVYELDHDDVTAVCGIEADGSGLVLVSDALLSLITYLSQLQSYVGGGSSARGRFTLLSALLRNGRGGTTRRQRVAAALLRYHLIQQQCFGLSGKLAVDLSADESELAAPLSSFAVFFVLAHEAAHFALGHPAAAFNVVSGVEMSVAADTEHLELRADAFAFDALLALAGDLPPEVANHLSLLGSGIALHAIAFVEESCFIRRARTHPPAAARWAAIRRGVPEVDARDAVGYLELLVGPLRSAVASSGPLSTNTWQDTFSSRDVLVTSHTTEAVAYTPMLDDLLHGTLPESLSGTYHLHPAIGTIDRLTSEATAEDLRHSLRALGVGETDVAEILDPRASLTHYSLITRLGRAESFSILPEETLRLVVECVTARRLAPLLTEVRTTS